MAAPLRLLVNLPPGFYRTPEVQPILARLNALGEVRRTSHNAALEIAGDLAWADAVLMWSWPALTEELLNEAPNLRFAAHLDLSQHAARVALARKLPVSVGRSAFSPAVAEMALGLILTSLRRVSTYHERMRGGSEAWVASFPDDIDPRERELTGRPLGIVGFGRVGRRLAELLEPFRVELRVVDPFVPSDALGRFGAKGVDLATLVRECDVIVLCAASNEGTKALIGREEIDAMRQDAVFVNVARAALVDTDALVARLHRGDLVAPVDVFDQEPLPADHPLRTAPNALLTPHRAGGTMASVDRILSGLIDDLERFLKGEPLRQPLTEAMVAALDA
ncbi:MAG: NAD(P)-dependent oxidoreductase [Fimbriimonas sp.]